MQYKLKTLRTSAQAALAFGKSFGIDIDSLVLRDVSGGKSLQKLHKEDSCLISVNLAVPKTRAFYASGN